MYYHTVQVLAAWLSHKEIYEHSKISTRTIFYADVTVGGGRGKILCSATFNQLDLQFLLIHDGKLVKLYTCAKYLVKQTSGCRDLSNFALWHFTWDRSWPQCVIAAFFLGGGVFSCHSGNFSAIKICRWYIICLPGRHYYGQNLPFGSAGWLNQPLCRPVALLHRLL